MSISPIERTYEQTRAVSPKKIKSAISLNEDQDRSFTNLIYDSIEPEVIVAQP